MNIEIGENLSRLLGLVALFVFMILGIIVMVYGIIKDDNK